MQWEKDTWSSNRCSAYLVLYIARHTHLHNFEGAGWPWVHNVDDRGSQTAKVKKGKQQKGGSGVQGGENDGLSVGASPICLPLLQKGTDVKVRS